MHGAEAGAPKVPKSLAQDFWKKGAEKSMASKYCPCHEKKPSSKKKIVKKMLLFEKCTASQREYQNHRNLTGEKSELARR